MARQTSNGPEAHETVACGTPPPPRSFTRVQVRDYRAAANIVGSTMPTEVDHYLSGVPLSLLQPNVILPAQHFGGRRPLAPEHRLMIAVLQDAIWCLEKHRFATNRLGRSLFEDVSKWIAAHETTWPYSFESICDYLNLDADSVRRRLGVGARVLVPGRERATRQGFRGH